MLTSTEKLDNLLLNFIKSTSGVEGAALISPDGLPLATNLPQSMDEERVAAISAAMLSLAERISNELERGDVERVFVEGDLGYGILTNCGEDAVLLVLASKAAKQGMLLLAIKKTIAALKQVLNGAAAESQNADNQNLRSIMRL
ncbi:MAG: roadblock/LC7 domain-containing protein [Prochloraceae cyanobacterium]|nr:roadblock/LC7 domain-containing protein [Prochloraceae cyanobacterium]